MSQPFLYMWRPEREKFISEHEFYVSESRKRLLSQFDDIEAEADCFGNKILARYGHLYNPDSDNSEQLTEAARDEMYSHYEMLQSMKKRTELSIISGIFHEWDKQLRAWVVREIKRWHCSTKIEEAIWKATFDDIIDLFESLAWPVRSRNFYYSINRCRLVVNTYKHGEGKAFESIKKYYPDLIYKIPGVDPTWDLVEYSRLEITSGHIEEFSKAIIDFWKDMPENLPCSGSLDFPKWFEKLFAT